MGQKIEDIIHGETIEPICWTVGLLFVKEAVNSGTDPEVIKSEKKAIFRKAEEEVRKNQKESIPEDGYILMDGNVYCVYHINTLTKKITGPVAKAVKRKMREFLAS